MEPGMSRSNTETNDGRRNCQDPGLENRDRQDQDGSWKLEERAAVANAQEFSGALLVLVAGSSTGQSGSWPSRAPCSVGC